MHTGSFADPDPLLKEIYSSTLDYGIFTFDLEGHITTWNAGAERIIGFFGKEIIGQDNVIIFTPEDRVRDESHQEMLIAKTTGRAEDYRWHLRKDGSRFWADGVLTPLHDASGRHTGYLKIFRDITDRMVNEAEMYRLANFDMLTGLANRYAFEKRAEDMITSATRSGQPLALHLVDLDHFKQVNDTLGHHAGDMLLQQASQRMQKTLRDSDFIARLGGDEFVVLQGNMPTPQAAADLAIKLIRELSQPFDMNGHEARVSASVGIALCPEDAADLDQLYKKADLALYRAKEDGKGRYHYFTEKLDAAAHIKSRDLAEIRLAVEKKEFWMEYQPKIAFSDGHIVAIEALLRCANPVLRPYPIETVLGLAMETKLIKDLSLWVVREVCLQFQKWQEDGLSDVRLCVNMCAQDLSDPDMPKLLDAIFAEAAMQPSDFEVEVTERQALDIEKYGLGILHALRSRGIRIALDDFGTGYSALSYLRSLPVTTVKLDKSFLVGIPSDVQGCAVIKGVMDISLALGLEIIAEGVETEEQAAFLKDNNCTALQGFLISKPLPAPAMTAWLLNKGSIVH